MKENPHVVSRREALAIFSGAVAMALVGCGEGEREDTATAEPPPTNSRPTNTPNATSTQEPGTQVGKGAGEAPTPTETPTPVDTRLPHEKEGFPYELAFIKEIKGDDVTIILGIEDAVYNRPEGNTCEENVQNSPRVVPCSRIRSISIGDEYLEEYASDLFPNGMSEEESIQRLNDFVIDGILFNLKMKSENASNLNRGMVKEMIHNGQLTEWSASFRDGSNIAFDINKPVYLILKDEPGSIINPQVKRLSTESTIDYGNFDGSFVAGLWTSNAYTLGFPEDLNPYHKFTYTPALGFWGPFQVANFNGSGQALIDFMLENGIENAERIIPVIDIPNKNIVSIIEISSESQ